MNRYSNYHTHTHFCDGADSPEAIVREALRLGCPEIGFSGHSYLPEDSCSMTPENTRFYREEVLRLREKYAGQIVIRLGIEQDYYSAPSQESWDYMIGSVHYVERGGEKYPVDLSRESFMQVVQKVYRGDYYAFAEDYYTLVADVCNHTGCSIIGHFDLITKFNEANSLFDSSHPRYRAAAEQALKSLLSYEAVMEINTGAMARGYRSVPYPEPWIISEWLRAGKPVILSSDCHDLHYLLHAFQKAEKLVDRPEFLLKSIPVKS